MAQCRRARKYLEIVLRIIFVRGERWPGNSVPPLRFDALWIRSAHTLLVEQVVARYVVPITGSVSGSDPQQRF